MSNLENRIHIVLIFSSAPARRKKQQVFEIRHVQTDQLSRILDTLVFFCQVHTDTSEAVDNKFIIIKY